MGHGQLRGSGMFRLGLQWTTNACNLQIWADLQLLRCRLRLGCRRLQVRPKLQVACSLSPIVTLASDVAQRKSNFCVFVRPLYYLIQCFITLTLHCFHILTLILISFNYAVRLKFGEISDFAAARLDNAYI